jgi:hypothetical protein
MNELAGMGRLVCKDERDKEHLMPRTLRAAAGVESRFWYLPPALDQGATSSCVGHGWAAWALAGPTTNRLPISPWQWYLLAQEVDEWPGKEPQMEGSSVRAGAKIAVSLKLASEYRWAFSVSPVVSWLLANGPVVVGTDLYEGMANPNAKTGLMTLAGQSLGGHCYLLGGVNKRTGLIRVLNSWGRNWAQNGRAWISIADMDKLIKADGEACVAVEVKQV